MRENGSSGSNKDITDDQICNQNIVKIVNSHNEIVGYACIRNSDFICEEKLTQ